MSLTDRPTDPPEERRPQGLPQVDKSRIVGIIDLELYGGKRAYISHLRAVLSNAVGLYRSAQTIDWAVVERLVFVCQGNICRSPYASERARALGVHAISLGIAAADGACADERAARNALYRGIALKDHRTTRVKASLILQGDLIVVFERAQQLQLMQQRVAGAVGITMLGLWAHPVRPHIQDPYGRSDRYFQQCFSVIDLNIQELVKRLEAHHAPAAVGSVGSGSSVHSAP